MSLRKKLPLVTLSLAGVMMISPIKADAQTDVVSAWKEISTKLASQELQSVHLTGDINVEIGSQDNMANLGEMNMDLSFNDQPIAFQMVGGIVSPFMGADAVGFEAYAKEGFTYIYNTQQGNWQVSEWTSSEEEIRQSITDSFKEAVQSFNQAELTPEYENFLIKYFDLTEEGTNYRFKLKEGIDGKAFYEDFDKAVDIEEVINEAVKNAKAQAETMGEEGLPSEQYEQNLRNVLNADTFAKFFKTNPVLDSVYDKETGNLKEMNVVLNLDAEFLKGYMGEEAATLPELIKVTGHFVVDQYGETINIQVPEEAIKAFQSQADGESTATDANAQSSEEDSVVPEEASAEAEPTQEAENSQSN